MSDRRATPANDRVAHDSLRGLVRAPRYTSGAEASVIKDVATIWRAPGEGRERQLVFGEAFAVLDVDGYAFGYAKRDGYVGYVAVGSLALPAIKANARICVRMTHALGKPDIKTAAEQLLLSFGARVHVVDRSDGWARITTNHHGLYVPEGHLCTLDLLENDPVAVAERFPGTPYVWGGNSAMGIDCSGLVQAACLACGIPCPGDSDQQEARLGAALPDGTPPERGDLLFWKGHVAWVVDSDTILHANAHHMAVSNEPLRDAVARIAAQGGGPVTAHKRLEMPK